MDILKSTAIEEILLERAQYSTERLKALGYTENQISILRTYDGGPLEDNPQLRGTFADLYGVVLKMAANQTSITLRLSWRWSNAPAMSGIAVHDLMAATWKASNSQGSTINVKLNSSKSSSYVHYYNGYNGNLEATEKQTITVNDPYSSAYVNFAMGRWMFGWAKDGWFDVCVDRVGSGNIYELAMVMGYGHSTFTVTPSVSFSSTGALGIGFSFSGRMEQMYQQALTCRYDGTITNY